MTWEMVAQIGVLSLIGCFVLVVVTACVKLFKETK